MFFWVLIYRGHDMGGLAISNVNLLGLCLGSSSANRSVFHYEFSSFEAMFILCFKIPFLPRPFPLGNDEALKQLIFPSPSPPLLPLSKSD